MFYPHQLQISDLRKQYDMLKLTTNSLLRWQNKAVEAAQAEGSVLGQSLSCVHCLYPAPSGGHHTTGHSTVYTPQGIVQCTVGCCMIKYNQVLSRRIKYNQVQLHRIKYNQVD